MNKDEFFKLSQQTTRGRPLKLYKQHGTKLTRINIFSNRIINDWNGLTSEIVTATSMNLFKNMLDKYWKGRIFDAPSVNFESRYLQAYVLFVLTEIYYYYY